MEHRFPMQELHKGCAALDITLSSKQADQFSSYYHAIHKWQAQIHLISALDTKRLISRHFLDSLTIFKSCAVDLGTTIADVGTGAGLPGIPMAIARPDLEISLVESNRKKANFLKYVVRELGMVSRVTVHHARAESLPAKQPVGYNIVVSRAVASVETMVKIALKMVGPNGMLLLFKGLEAERELEQAEMVLDKLHGRIEQIIPATISKGDGAVHVIIRRD